MSTKKTTLRVAKQVGLQICLLKIHIGIVEDYHPHFINHLKEIADRHNFLLLED
jgi:uridine monophosphate synthetase